MPDTKTTLTWLLKDQVSGTAAKLDKTLGGLNDRATKSPGILGKVGGALGEWITPTNAIIAGGAALVGFLGLSAKAAAEEQVNVERMNTALKASVPGFDGNTTAIEQLIKKREDLAFSDDELRASFATLVTSTHDVGKASDMQALAMDLARLKGVDLATASEALAKANVGSTRELKALGIAVDDSKDKTQVFAAIQKAAAGQAAAYAETTGGKWASFQNKMHDVMEDVGKALIPVMNALADVLLKVVIPAIETIVGVIGTLIGWIQSAVGWFQSLFSQADQLKNRPELNQATGKSAYNPYAHRAAGGPVQAGSAYIVGENGPEMLVMGRQSGTVIPHGANASMVPVSIPVIIDGREIARIADRNLYYHLQRAPAGIGRA